MEPWPESDQPADFATLVDPICDAIRFAYVLQRQNTALDIPYSGLEIGQHERATCLLARHQLSAERLAYSDEDQGRDALTEIIALALRIGIEQGRRIFKHSDEYRTLQTYEKIAELFLNKP